jgi:hypothetical protein
VDVRQHAHMRVFIEELECSRYSPDRNIAECDERGEVALGALTVIGVLALVVGYVIWRRVMRRYRTSSNVRSHAAAHPESIRPQMRTEYEAKIAAGDPDSLEASRDWHDNVGSSWRMEAGMALYLLVLFGSLLFLIPLFVLFKALAS